MVAFRRNLFDNINSAEATVNGERVSVGSDCRVVASVDAHAMNVLILLAGVVNPSVLTAETVIGVHLQVIKTVHLFAASVQIVRKECFICVGIHIDYTISDDSAVKDFVSDQYPLGSAVQTAGHKISASRFADELCVIDGILMKIVPDKVAFHKAFHFIRA